MVRLAEDCGPQAVALHPRTREQGYTGSADWSRIAEVTYEEGTGRLFAGGVAHHELYLRFGEALGMSRRELYDWPLCAEAIAYMQWFMNICGRSFIEGASAHMLASEAVGMTFYVDVANALLRAAKHSSFRTMR